MKEGVYLLKLELKNVGCFDKEVMLNLSDGKGNWKNWNVIVGNNGTGKTTLLKAIAGLECEENVHNGKEWSASNSLFIHYNLGKSLFRKETESLIIDAFIFESFEHNYKISLEYSNNRIYGFGTIDFKDKLPKIYGYGANRFMSRNTFTKSDSKNLATLFDEDARLINAEEWLIDLDYKAIKATQNSEEKGFLIKQRDLALQLLRNILPNDGVLDIRFTEPSRHGNSTVEFQTPYGWVTIHQLSLGYKTMVAWMVDLAARLFERYPNEDNPIEQPAIVLVDEIDLHMHPKWQRQIFDHIEKTFPKTQFIVTAHSPLIVQSAPKDANIVLLRREGDHVIIDNDIQSVHNWRIDQILNSDLFGNISQRSPETEEWINERKTLIQKGNLTEAEQQRLKELNKMAHELPTADNPRDIEAMEIIREAAEYFKSQKSGTPV